MNALAQADPAPPVQHAVGSRTIRAAPCSLTTSRCRSRTRSGGCTTTDYTVDLHRPARPGPDPLAGPGLAGIRRPCRCRASAPVPSGRERWRRVASPALGRGAGAIRTRGKNQDNPCGRPKWTIEDATGWRMPRRRAGARLVARTCQGSSRSGMPVRAGTSGAGGKAGHGAGRSAHHRGSDAFGPLRLRRRRGCTAAIGSLPGVAWTDYAFTFYCDTATQLYPVHAAQVETSMLRGAGGHGLPRHRAAGPRRTANA